MVTMLWGSNSPHLETLSGGQIFQLIPRMKPCHDLNLVTCTAAYRQYNQLKTRQSCGERPVIKKGTAGETSSTSKLTVSGTEKTRIEEVGEDVFGSSLNKQMDTKKKLVAKVEDRDSKSTWKLRRWTKKNGYVTVTVGGDGQEKGGGGTVDVSSISGGYHTETQTTPNKVLIIISNNIV